MEPLVVTAAPSMTDLSSVDLRAAWADLGRRRPALAPALAIYGEILDAWAGWPPPGVRPLGWSAADCRARWERGVPLAAEAPPPPVAAAEAEDLLGALLEVLVPALGPGDAAAIARLTEAWDRGEVTLSDFLPAPGRLGAATLATDAGLRAELAGVLASLVLPPVLGPYFGSVRAHLAGGRWTLGICPFCGAPPGFGDVLEDGRRQLACHVCGGEWIFPRVCCPGCGNACAADLLRLQPEDADEGYAIEACLRCRAYVKELDRRTRWNGGPALVEDWGSPHLDVIAQRRGYWRALPTLAEVAAPRRP